MSEMSVKMMLTLTDGATRPLQEFIDKLKSMDASLKSATPHLSEVGRIMEGLKISPRNAESTNSFAASLRSVAKTAPAASESLNNFAASLRRAVETSPLIKSLATELNALGAAMQTVKTSSNGLGADLTSIGNRAGGASIQMSKFSETMVALDAAMNAAKAKIDGTAAAFGALGTEAHAAGAGVMSGTKNIAFAGDEVAATTTKVDGLGASLKAMAAIWAGLKLEKGLVSSVDSATQYQTEEVKLKMLNMPKGEAESISKKAWADSEKFKFASPLDALKVRQATMEAMATQRDESIIDQTAQAALKATNVLKMIGVEGDPKDITKNLLSLSEMRMQTNDPTKIKHNMDLMLQASLATGGKVTPADIDIFGRRFGAQGMATMSDDALMASVALIDQAKVAGGGAGGGGGASMMGTALKMIQAYMLGKPMPKKAALMFEEMGIFRPGSILPGSTTTHANIREGSVVDRKLAAENMPAFLQKYMPQVMAYTERYASKYYEGKDAKRLTRDDRDAALQSVLAELGISVTAQTASMLLMNPRSIERTNKMVENQKRASNVDQAQKQLDDSQAQKVQNFNAQLEKLKIAIGESILPAVTKFVEWLNKLLDTFGKFAKENPLTTSILTGTTAITGGALAVAGFAKLFGVAFKSAGKAADTAAGDAVAAEGKFASAFGNIAAASRTMAIRIAEYLAPIGATLSSIIGGIGMLLYSKDAGAAPMPGGEMGAEIAATMREKGKMQMPKEKLNIKSILNRYSKKPEAAYPESSTEGMNPPVPGKQGKSGRGSTFDQQLSDLKQGNILIEDEIKRHQRELAREFTAQRIGIREYYAKDLEDAQKLLKAEISLLEQERHRQNQLGDKRGAAATGTQITLKRRDLAELPQASEAKQREAMDALKKEQESVNAEYSKLSGESDTAGAIAATQSSGDKTAAMFRLNKMDDAAQKADNLTKLKIEHIQFADAMQKVTDITEARDRAEKQLNYDVAAGTITALDAANKQTEIKKQWARDIQNPLDTAAQYATTSADKKTVQQQAQEGKAALDSLNSSAQQVKNSMQGAFANFFDGLVAGTKNVRQLFKGLFDQIAQSITKMISQNMADSLMNSMFGIQPGGGQGGQSTGIMATLLGKLFGGGGSSGIPSGGASADGMGAGAGSGISSFFGKIFGGMASFAVGTDYVPQDMIAMIHKGEKITPAAYNTPKFNAQNGVIQHLNFNFSQPQSTETMLQMAGAMNNAMRQAQRNM